MLYFTTEISAIAVFHSRALLLSDHHCVRNWKGISGEVWEGKKIRVYIVRGLKVGVTSQTTLIIEYTDSKE